MQQQQQHESERGKLIQQQFVLLRHAQRCMQNDKVNP